MTTSKACVMVPVATLKRWKEIIEPYWFSAGSETELEDNNYDIIALSQEIDAAIGECVEQPATPESTTVLTTKPD